MPDFGHTTAFADYTIDLTGVGNGAVANGVYVSPYQGTITGNGTSYWVTSFESTFIPIHI